MTKTPVIGITAGLQNEQQPGGLVIRHRVSADYSKAVRSAGGLPIILPPQEETIEEILDLVDGLIFSGGADIDPVRYGATDIHPATYDISEERDRFEIDLLRGAVDRDLPVLCICRGIQILNVALGGSLIQDIADQVGHPLEHRQGEAGFGARDASHMVELIPNSLASQVYGGTAILTNSFHHQSIAEPGPSVRVEGSTSDGVIEAVSVPGCSFVLGVQWHPEMLAETMPVQRKPFEALVAAARTASAVGAGV